MSAHFSREMASEHAARVLFRARDDLFPQCPGNSSAAKRKGPGLLPPPPFFCVALSGHVLLEFGVLDVYLLIVRLT